MRAWRRNGRRWRSFAGEGDVRVAGAEYEICLIKHVRHGPVERPGYARLRRPGQRLSFPGPLHPGAISPESWGCSRGTARPGRRRAAVGWPWPTPHGEAGAPVRWSRHEVLPSAASRRAASSTSSVTSARTWAMPRSVTIAAVMPVRSYSPSAASQPPTTGKLGGPGDRSRCTHRSTVPCRAPNGRGSRGRSSSARCSPWDPSGSGRRWP